MDDERTTGSMDLAELIPIVEERRAQKLLATDAGMPVPGGLLATLRNLDQEIARLRVRLDALVEGFFAGAGLTGMPVNLDLDSGTYRVVAPPEE